MQQLIPHYLDPRLWMINQGRGRSACVEAKTALFKEVGAAGHPAGGREATASSRSVDKFGYPRVIADFPFAGCERINIGV